MKHVIALLLALALLAAALGHATEPAARPLEPGDWSQIRLVISGQLAAFQRDDAKAAFFFAAPELRSQYRTPGEYLRMVRTGYKAVYRSRSVRFLHHFVVAGQPVQPLEIITGDEQLAVAYYVMQRQHDGSWKISRCSLPANPATPL
jgi:Domain of unknown function (DUF4864)